MPTQSLTRETGPKSPPEKERRGRRSVDAHRRELEQSVRRFLDYAAHHPLHRFAAGTARFIEEAKSLIEQMDALEAARK